MHDTRLRKGANGSYSFKEVRNKGGLNAKQTGSATQSSHKRGDSTKVNRSLKLLYMTIGKDDGLVRGNRIAPLLFQPTPR